MNSDHVQISPTRVAGSSGADTKQTTNATDMMSGRQFNLYLASLELRTAPQDEPRIYQTFIISGATDDNTVERRTTADLRFKRVLNGATGTYRYTSKWHVHTSRAAPAVLARMHVGRVRGARWAALLQFIAAPNHVEHVQQARAREGRGDADSWDAVRWAKIVLVRLMRTTLVRMAGVLDVERVVPAMREFLEEIAEGRHAPGDDGRPPTVGCPLKAGNRERDDRESQVPSELSDFSQSV
ncbi:hypothetical protein B0H21DRAFT_883415 [Amylocystis lapponica]|nr:hypothetical protein B0H21DRAFT_883415 [Amylocystis lapponica]